MSGFMRRFAGRQIMSKEIIIIGGGLGGLMTGALLSKEGFKITLLEKNAVIGGGLQNFYRNGLSFDTGMHILGGFGEEGSLRRICTYLGIMDKLQIKEVDSNCMESLYYISDEKEYRIAPGKEGFVESLSSFFPDCREELKNYVEALMRISSEFKLFHLEPSGETIQQHSSEFIWPVERFIAHYISNRKLRNILAYSAPLYSGIKGETPAYIHALINTLYISGTYRFAGGSQHFAEALAGVIRENGGRVLAKREVERIAVSERRVTGVICSNGEEYCAENYISAVDISHLLEITDSGAFPKAYRERIDSIPRSYSVFTLYIVFKEGSFPYINSTGYIMDHYDSIWNVAESGAKWPYGVMYMTPPEENQGRFATKMIINSPMEFSQTAAWESSVTGARGEEYLEWKRERQEQLLDLMERRFPNFRESISKVYSSSPLTIRDYFNNRLGGMYGVRKDCNNMMLSQIPPATKVKNLFLTGQNIGLHGICGVPLSAIITSEIFLGRERLLEKIRNFSRRALLFIALLCTLVAGRSIETSAQERGINIWEGTGLHEPEIILTPYCVKGTSRTAVIICSGGSYCWHDSSSEGKMVARWLNSRNISAFLLNYRTEGFVAAYSSFNRGLQYGYPGVVKDLQRAIALLKERADEFGIDPERIGVMGFSAGGHLALLSAHYSHIDFASGREIKGETLRPAFVAAIYPVVTMSEERLVHKRSRSALLRYKRFSAEVLDSLSMERNIPSGHPPLFLLHCKDDGVVNYRNSLLLDSALTRNMVAHKFLQYNSGGHGFGADPERLSAENSRWMDEFEEWLKEINEYEIQFVEGEIQRGH